MTNGSDIIEYEEKNYDKLIDEFCELPRYKELWGEFVEEKYNEDKS